MTIQYRKFLNLLLFFKWISNNLLFFCFLSSTYPKSRTFLADFRQKFKYLVPVLLKNWPLTPSWHSRADPWSPRGTWSGPWSMVTKILSQFLPIDHWSTTRQLKEMLWLACIEYFCWVDYQGIDSLHVLDWDLCKFWFVFEFLLHKSNCKLHSTSMSSNDHSLKNLTWACIKNILKYTWTMVCIAGSSDLFMSLSMAVLPLVLRSVFEMVVI